MAGAKAFIVEFELLTPLLAPYPKKLIKENPYAFPVELEHLQKYPHVDRVFRRTPDGKIDPNQFRNMLYTVISKELPGAEIQYLFDIIVNGTIGLEAQQQKGVPVFYEILRPGSKIVVHVVGKHKVDKGYEKEVFLGAQRRRGFGRAKMRIL